MEEADKQIVNFDKTPAFSQGVRCARLLSPMRGGGHQRCCPLCTPRFSLSTAGGWAPGSFLGGFAPTAPEGGRSAPRPGGFCGTAVPAPTCRRSARAWLCHARHPGDFRFTTKVTKGVSGGAPLNPHWGAIIIPPAARACMRLPLPPESYATIYS